MRATVLCENRVFEQPGLVAEHGWSVFLETAAGNFLFDTGQGMTIVRNARELGKDLMTCRGIILSHHHWDHTGGLRAVLEVVGGIDIFTHPDLFKESFRLKDGEMRPIGTPFQPEELERLGARFHFNREFVEIADGVFLTGEIPRRTAFEKGDGRLVVRAGSGYEQDRLLDDQALVTKSEEGLSVVLGCSHAGVVNTLEYVLEKTGASRIHTVIGGTHLGPLPEEEMEESIRALQAFGIERIGVAHCTGMRPSLRLMEEFGQRFFFCTVGDVVLPGAPDRI
jgi:7,8-dihydropterin-6-yl-methyl-4-(beta-D-ribofuranosyl)aminobenzene 5'-phosphate synthase